MELTYETSFTIMPNQCNYHTPLVFGGALFSQMDLCAAVCATRLLRCSPAKCDSAVTHKANITFHKPSFLGDIVFLKAEVVELRKKAIVLKVTAEKEERLNPERIFIAEGDFVFVSKKGEEYIHHGIEFSKQ